MAITRIKNNQITDQTITNVKIASATLTGDLMNPQLTFNSNLTLNGNLVVMLGQSIGCMHTLINQD